MAGQALAMFRMNSAVDWVAMISSLGNLAEFEAGGGGPREGVKDQDIFVGDDHDGVSVGNVAVRRSDELVDAVGDFDGLQADSRSVQQGERQERNGPDEAESVSSDHSFGSLSKVRPEA